MNDTNREYAEALFALSKESGTEDETLSDLKTVLAVFNDNPGYIDLLSSLSIPKADRTDAIDKAFSGTVSEYVLNFTKLLCEKNHIRDFEGCFNEYEQFYQLANRISVATVRSAVELTSEQKSSIKARLEKHCGHSIELRCMLDESIMGGIIAEVDGEIIDGSLKEKLHSIKEVIDR